ncbi:hypothetical protein NQZ68_013602 [Dissostichus eleginoides]|nr:hypothetical protein NQZ68_013602 [Dissostichus eleginoides]
MSPVPMRGNEPRSVERRWQAKTRRNNIPLHPANLINWASTPVTALAFKHTANRGPADADLFTLLQLFDSR